MASRPASKVQAGVIRPTGSRLRNLRSYIRAPGWIMTDHQQEVINVPHPCRQSAKMVSARPVRARTTRRSAVASCDCRRPCRGGLRRLVLISGVDPRRRAPFALAIAGGVVSSRGCSDVSRAVGRGGRAGCGRAPASVSYGLSTGLSPTRSSRTRIRRPTSPEPPATDRRDIADRRLRDPQRQSAHRLRTTTSRLVAELPDGSDRRGHRS